MDITVTPKAADKPGENIWILTDLLGRSMGEVSEREDGGFQISPAGRALETMKSMRHGPYASLDAALAEIERFTRGTCRRVAPTGDDGSADAG